MIIAFVIALCLKKKKKSKLQAYVQGNKKREVESERQSEKVMRIGFTLVQTEIRLTPGWTNFNGL